MVSRKSMLLAATLATGLAGETALLTTSAIAQQDKMMRPPQQAAATIYRDAYFAGPAVYVDGNRPDMGLAWPVNSIRIEAGRWQLCEKTRFRGTCRTYDVTTAQLTFRGGHKVQSIRLLSGGGGGGGGLPVVPGQNPSLRGMAAQFYAAPAANGLRIVACERGNSTANCAAATADRFCVQNGWKGAARQAMETVSGRIYLVDVLCTLTGY